MTITLTREEAQQVLDFVETVKVHQSQIAQREMIAELLCARLSAPEPKSVKQRVDETIAILGEPPYAELSEPEPTRSEKMRDAGVTRRPKGWSKDGDEPSMEPVAWGVLNTRLTERQTLMMVMTDQPPPSDFVVPLYTAPPQREWQSITERQIEACMKKAYETVQGRNLEIAFARAIEAKLREKNT